MTNTGEKRFQSSHTERHFLKTVEIIGFRQERKKTRVSIIHYIDIVGVWFYVKMM